jgi:hypothetical protein
MTPITVKGSSIINQPPSGTAEQAYLNYLAGLQTWADPIMLLGMVLTRKQTLMSLGLNVDTQKISDINDQMADVRDMEELMNNKLATLTQDPPNDSDSATVYTASSKADMLAFTQKLDSYGIQYTANASSLTVTMTRKQMTTANTNLNLKVDNMSSESTQQQGTLQRDIGRLDTLGELISTLFQRAGDMFHAAAGQ